MSQVDCLYTQLAYTKVMKRIFIETPLFTRLLPEYLSDEAYRLLQQALLENPELGEVMPDTGGFRKLRWPDARRGKGKRSGLRVIYYHLSTDRQVWFFTIYGKDEMSDLSSDDKRQLKAAIQKELAARRKKK